MSDRPRVNVSPIIIVFAIFACVIVVGGAILIFGNAVP